jgi:hypothetical protein
LDREREGKDKEGIYTENTESAESAEKKGLVAVFM